MRTSTLFLAGPAILLAATVAFALEPSPKATPPPGIPPPEKGVQVPGPPDPIHVDQGGDTIASALPVGSMPFTDSGTTVGYVDNYSPNCGYAGGAPDVVYSFSPGISGVGSLSLCGSNFDTELYVYQDTQGNIVGCNDDSCGLQSQLTWPCLAGHTYYIIIDGYSNFSGAYTINVCCLGPPCTVTCPPGSLLEGEAICSDDYYDSYNGGCNSVPPVFLPLECSPTGTQTICGTYGGFLYAGLSYRDTDWYQITIPPGGSPVVTWTVRGETDTLLGIINGNAGCPASAFYTYTYGAKCTDLSVSAALSPGTWWLWVGTLNFGSTAGPCGQDYLATLSGYDCGLVAVQPATWGRIKSLYR